MTQLLSALILVILPTLHPPLQPNDRSATPRAISAPPKDTPPSPNPPAPAPPAPAPPAPAPAPAPPGRTPTSPPAPALRCTLRTQEAPRGGRLEVEGDAFGKTPVLRIGGRIARILERSKQRIAVQIPRDSDGGAVTVTAGGTEAECGSLTIIGRN